LCRRQKRHYTAPACGFWIDNFFQFLFSTKQNASLRHCRALAYKNGLKKMKRISVVFSFQDRKRIAEKH
jgi:hypothetical protein